MFISVISLWVEDLDRAIAFYTNNLGWKVTMDAPMGDGTRWVTIGPEGSQASFTLATRERDPDEFKIGNSGVIFEVESVESTHTALSGKGVEFTMAPEEMPWGGWAMFKDSEGNIHGLHSPVREAVGNA